MPKATIYIVSVSGFAGKTALIAGIGRRYAAAGVSIGYIKPLSVAAGKLPSDRDDDAALAKELFGLKEPDEVLAPVILEMADIHAILQDDQPRDFRSLVCSAFETASAGKDLMLIEGAANWQAGELVDLPAAEVGALLDTRVLLAVRWRDVMTTDEILGARDALGGRLIGCVINTVPNEELDEVDTAIRRFLERKGVRVFAVIPQDRVLQGMTVNQIAELVEGQILCSPERGDQLVEAILVGAMNAASALDYFCQVPNKVVITGGDRADIQLAALESPTKALVLTGNIRPHQVVINRATELGIPLILTKRDTLGAVDTIEDCFGKVRFYQQRKIERIDTLLDEHFDFDALDKMLRLLQK
jgi:uncharacterized protein